MKREKFLIASVIVLFLLNAATLGFLFFQRGHRPSPVHMERLIPETLDFDKEQVQKFDVLRNEHHSQMIVLDEKNKQAMINYLELLKGDSINAAEKDSLEKTIAGIQQKRAEITIDHFAKLKAVCSAEQKEKFNTLIPQLIRVMTDTHQPEPKP